ncbi:MAG: DUF2189 domain-containing protein [Chromatiales bacterium]|nr:DUF2189 domain-containing protein [Chromatiales bacterium]
MAASAPTKITVSAIGRWLGLGWQHQRKSLGLSMLYALPFVLICILLEWGLMYNGYALISYLLAGGFLLLLPPLLVVYYQIIDQQNNNQPVTAGTLLQAFRNTPSTIWGLLVIAIILYLIWITDALIVYTVYFTLDPLDLDSYGTDQLLRGEVNEFLFYATLMGAVIGVIAFAITAFAIPKAFYQKAGFVDAVVYSIKTIFRHFPVMVPWALLVGSSQLLALTFFPPLELLLLPLFAFANYYAYQDSLIAAEGAVADAG